MRPFVESVGRSCIGYLLAIGLLGMALNASAVDLIYVYRLAVSNDSQFLSAGAANRAAQEGIPQARAQLLPNASLRYSSEYEHERTRSGGTFGATTGTERFNTTRFTFSLAQPIYRKDLLIGLSQADSRVQQANADYAFALQDLQLRSAERYFDVLEAADELEFRLAERDANEQQLRQSQQRFGRRVNCDHGRGRIQGRIRPGKRRGDPGRDSRWTIAMKRFAS